MKTNITISQECQNNIERCFGDAKIVAYYREEHHAQDEQQLAASGEEHAGIRTGIFVIYSEAFRRILSWDAMLDEHGVGRGDYPSPIPMPVSDPLALIPPSAVWFVDETERNAIRGHLSFACGQDIRFNT